MEFFTYPEKTNRSALSTKGLAKIKPVSKTLFWKQSLKALPKMSFSSVLGHVHSVHSIIYSEEAHEEARHLTNLN